MGAFADSLKANVKQIKEDINQQITYVAVDLFRDIVYASPSHDLNGSEWATGWIINQWYPSVKRESRELNQTRDQMGFDSLDRIAQLPSQNIFLRKDNTLYFTNNVPYVYQADSLGWSRTLPYMMVDKSLAKARGRLA